jgi:hypothetical protein
MNKTRIKVIFEQEGQWITIHGVHVLVHDDEDPAGAFKRVTGKSLPPPKSPTVRDPSHRLPLKKIKTISDDIAQTIKVNPADMWLGGSQSPKSGHFPRASSDIDFFVFPQDFKSDSPADWQKYALKTATLNLDDIKQKYGRDVSVTFMPEDSKKQIADHIPLRKS